MELTKKSATVEAPQAVFGLGNWEWRVLKTYQKDDAKPFARWLVAAKSPHTFGSFDMGDTYVRDILVEAQADLVEVDGHDPTPEDRAQILALRAKLAASKDPLREAFGF